MTARPTAAAHAPTGRLQPLDGSRTSTRATITVAVVGICGARHLARCLGALEAQDDAPPFDVVVAADPRLPGMEDAARGYRGSLRMVSAPGRENPVDLAADALRIATGELVLLTEDHCVPPPRWVRTLHDAARATPGAAVLGGGVDTDDDASLLEWAFYFVDFFRYAPPLARGPAPSLSLCNIAYRRPHLEALVSVWTDGYHETALNEAHRARFGSLDLVPDAAVRMRRRVTFGDALRERYAFGRLFACTRLAHVGMARRALYATLAPALPALLLARMAAKALPAPTLRGRFLRALPMLLALVLAWSWGEWVGYLTARRPGDLTTAPETLEER